MTLAFRLESSSPEVLEPEGKPETSSSRRELGESSKGTNGEASFTGEASLSGSDASDQEEPSTSAASNEQVIVLVGSASSARLLKASDYVIVVLLQTLLTTAFASR